MAVHEVSVLPEHLKVVELGRRRRWSENDKLRIVMKDINPQAWLADVLGRIAFHPAKRLGELLPWNWQPIQTTPASLDAAA